MDEVDPFNASDEVSTFTPDGIVNVVFSQGSVTLDGDFVMNGGVLTCTATGSGGKGISCDGTGFFNGGTVNASAAGTDFTKGSVHPKAIKCDGDIEVTGGEITVSSNRHEAMTTGGAWNQSGGSVIADAYDDAINSAGIMTITGGCLYGRGPGGR